MTWPRWRRNGKTTVVDSEAMQRERAPGNALVSPSVKEFIDRIVAVQGQLAWLTYVMGVLGQARGRDAIEAAKRIDSNDLSDLHAALHNLTVVVESMCKQARTKAIKP